MIKTKAVMIRKLVKTIGITAAIGMIAYILVQVAVALYFIAKLWGI